MKYPKVLKNDEGIRPAGSPNHCYYCSSRVGEEHGPECVVVLKKIKVKATIEYEIQVPHFWDKEQIEFRYNEGTWCADNIVNQIQTHIDKNQESGCLCGSVKVKYIETTDDTPTVVRD